MYRDRCIAKYVEAKTSRKTAPLEQIRHVRLIRGSAKDHPLIMPIRSVSQRLNELSLTQVRFAFERAHKVDEGLR